MRAEHTLVAAHMNGNACMQGLQLSMCVKPKLVWMRLTVYLTCAQQIAIECMSLDSQQE